MSESIAGVAIPDSQMANETTVFIQDAESPLLYHHSRRTYLFGVLHGQRLGIEADRFADTDPGAVQQFEQRPVNAPTRSHRALVFAPIPVSNWNSGHVFRTYKRSGRSSRTRRRHLPSQTDRHERVA